MLCGVIAYAVAIEAIITHPTDPLSFGGRLALALGLVLFVGGIAAAMGRATCGRLVPRVLIVTVTGLLVVVVGVVPPLASLAIAFAGVAAIALIEHRADPC
jgi:hypothetical protein